MMSCSGNPGCRREESFIFVARKPEETRLLGSEMAKFSYPGLTICLTGKLGTGKTEFVRGFAAEFGWENTRSPSFTIINEYRAQTPIAHVDLYRVEEPSGEEFHLEEYSRDGYVVIVEWADHLKISSEQGFWKIDLSYPAETSLYDPANETIRILRLSCFGRKACLKFREFTVNSVLKLERVRS